MPAPIHVNDQIRAAVVGVLAGLPTTGARVDEDELAAKSVIDPRLVVKVATDSVDAGVQALQQRNIRITVTGYAKEAAGLSTTLGAIQCEVEIAMAGAGSLGGLIAGGIQFQRDERGVDYVLEKPVGFVTLEFAGLCFTRNGAPGSVA